jgi:hypothetical protein
LFAATWTLLIARIGQRDRITRPLPLPTWTVTRKSGPETCSVLMVARRIWLTVPSALAVARPRMFQRSAIFCCSVV